jgi:5-methylcytosine-specific restriction protein A
VDHIVPRSAGGADTPGNLQPLCRPCHSRKTARFDGGYGRPIFLPGGPRLQTVCHLTRNAAKSG